MTLHLFQYLDKKENHIANVEENQPKVSKSYSTYMFLKR